LLTKSLFLQLSVSIKVVAFSKIDDSRIGREIRYSHQRIDSLTVFLMAQSISSLNTLHSVEHFFLRSGRQVCYLPVNCFNGGHGEYYNLAKYKNFTPPSLLL